MPGRKRVVIKGTAPVRLYSNEEAVKLLENYTEIDLNILLTLPRGCGIRYYTKDGIFKYGGYISNAMVEGRGHYVGSTVIHKKYLRLCGSKFGGGFMWMVSYDDISKIFRENNELDDVKICTNTLTESYNTILNQLDVAMDRINMLENVVTDLTIKFGQSIKCTDCSNADTDTDMLTQNDSVWSWKDESSLI